ncbi:MAG: SurA N-terminal domain-containing protein [Deltaproteobacteria bacterium]|nr:SurA N-terminal domain-containing protein [Deltaproteobacteria bacterium]MCL4872851.1 SurA N-terminal domain-containing protein [bacterium]
MMLESIRKRRNSAVILVAFAAIILVFIFWGVGPGGGGGDANAVATVNGESISVRDYMNLYKREVDYYRSVFKEQFTDEMERELNLKQRSVDILVNRILAVKEARKQGMEVSEKEVQDTIKAIPAFNNNGTFDKELYFKVLNSNRVSPAEFEKNIETDLLTAKIREKILRDVSVTDEEVRDRYMKENRKINLDYVSVDGESLKKGIEVSDEEALAYYKQNASRFMVPRSVNAFFAFASFAEFAKNAPVTAEEVSEFYERNKGQFETPAAVKARHILVRPEPGVDSEKARADAKQKIDGLLEKVRSGGDFAAIARQSSQDPGSASQGGDLGWFQQGIMIKAFEEAAFALKKGEVSGVVETEFGFHVIKVEDRKDPGHMPIKEVEPAIRKTLGESKAKNAAKEALAGLDSKIARAGTAEEMKKEAASIKGVRTAVTGFFTEVEPPAELAGKDDLRNTMLTLPPGQGRTVDAEDGVYLVRVLERKEASVPEFKDAAPEVKDILATEKALKAAREKAVQMVERLKNGEDLKAIASSEKLNVGSTGYFSPLDGFMPRTGIFTGDKEGLFELSQSAPNFPEVLVNEGKHYVLRFAGAREAPESGLEFKKEDIRSRVLAEKEEEVLGEWLNGLRQRSEITVNRDLL